MSFIFIFLLSTLITQPSNGRRLNRVMRAPEYLEPENKNIYNLYDDRVDNNDDKDFKDETRFDDGRYDDDEEYGSRRLFEWFSRLFKSTTPHPQTVETTTESVYSKELKERIFLKALHRNLTHVLVKLSEIEKQVSYAMDQKEAYAILTKGKPKLLTNSGFYYGDRRKREITATAETDTSKRDTKIDTADEDKRKRETKTAVEGDEVQKVTNTATYEGDRGKKGTKVATFQDDSKRNVKIARKKKNTKATTVAGNRKKTDTNKATVKNDTKKETKRHIIMATAPGNRRKRDTKMAAGTNDKRYAKRAAIDGNTKKRTEITIAEGDRRKREIRMATAPGNRRKRDTKMVIAIKDKKKDAKVATAEDKKTGTKTTEESTETVTEKLEAININTTECPCNITSGRRLGSMPTPTEVKNKLLLYLQESFQEIKAKIMSLRNLKQAFSDNISFKIGYILANIDTLEVSMLNLKNNMDKNKELWQDNKILELYDTLKVSNQAVSGLIESLKSYLEKLSYPQANSQLNFG